jgi:NADH-quinone oxidoreductase subunit C/D
VKVIRVMISELLRISNHLRWCGTFAQDVGQLLPAPHMFNDRARISDMVEALCDTRRRSGWLRIGGVAHDLPRGWKKLVKDFLHEFPPRLDRYRATVLENRVFRSRTLGIGKLGREEAIEWGVTGPNLRASGLEWDLRKKRPYSGYEQFEFEVPISEFGDSYSRAVVRVDEMRQSLRIIRQCLDDMPAGPSRASHPLTALLGNEMPAREIETLIDDFLGVSRGPVIPPGEAMVSIEDARGINGCYLVSDGRAASFRTRIRSPSFPHRQVLGLLTRGLMFPDLLAVLGSMDHAPAEMER